MDNNKDDDQDGNAQVAAARTTVAKAMLALKKHEIYMSQDINVHASTPSQTQRDTDEMRETLQATTDSMTQKLLVYSKCIDDVICAADTFFCLSYTGEEMCKHGKNTVNVRCASQDRDTRPLPMILGHEIYTFFETVLLSGSRGSELDYSQELSSSHTNTMHLTYHFLTTLGMSRIVRSITIMIKTAKIIRVLKRALHVALEFGEWMLVAVSVDHHEVEGMTDVHRHVYKKSEASDDRSNNSNKNILITFAICVAQSIIFTYASGAQRGTWENELIAVMKIKLQTFNASIPSASPQVRLATPSTSSYIVCIIILLCVLNFEDQSDGDVRYGDNTSSDYRQTNATCSQEDAMTMIISSNTTANGHLAKRVQNIVPHNNSSRNEICDSQSHDDQYDHNSDSDNHNKDTSNNDIYITHENNNNNDIEFMDDERVYLGTHDDGEKGMCGWVKDTRLSKSACQVLESIFLLPSCHCVESCNRTSHKSLTALLDAVHIISFYNQNSTWIDDTWFNGMDNDDVESSRSSSNIILEPNGDILKVFLRLCIFRMFERDVIHTQPSAVQSIDDMIVCDMLSIVVVSITAIDPPQFISFLAAIIDDFSYNQIRKVDSYVVNKLSRAFPEHMRIFHDSKSCVATLNAVFDDNSMKCGSHLSAQSNESRKHRIGNFLDIIRSTTVQHSYEYEFDQMKIHPSRESDHMLPSHLRPNYFSEFESYLLSGGDPFDIQRIMLIKAANIANVVNVEHREDESDSGHISLHSPFVVCSVIDNLRAIDDALRLQVRFKNGNDKNMAEPLSSHVIDSIYNDALAPLLRATCLKNLPLECNECCPLLGWIGFSSTSLSDIDTDSPIHVAPFGLIDAHGYDNDDNLTTTYTFSRIWSVHSHLEWLQLHKSNRSEVLDDIQLREDKDCTNDHIQSEWDLGASVLLIQCYFRWLTCSYTHSLSFDVLKIDDEFAPCIVFGASDQSFALGPENVVNDTPTSVYLASLFEIAECVTQHYSEYLIERKVRLGQIKDEEMTFTHTGIATTDGDNTFEIFKRYSEIQSLQHHGMSVWMKTLRKNVTCNAMELVLGGCGRDDSHHQLAAALSLNTYRNDDGIKSTLHACRCCCGLLIMQLANSVSGSRDSTTYALHNECFETDWFQSCNDDDTLALINASLRQLIDFVSAGSHARFDTTPKALSEKPSYVLSEIVGTFRGTVSSELPSFVVTDRMYIDSTNSNFHKPVQCGVSVAAHKLQMIESMITNGTYSELLICSSLLAECRDTHTSGASHSEKDTFALSHRLFTELILEIWHYCSYYPLLLKELASLTALYEDNSMNINFNIKREVWGFRKQLEAMNAKVQTNHGMFTSSEDVVRAIALIELNDYVPSLVDKTKIDLYNKQHRVGSSISAIETLCISILTQQTDESQKRASICETVPEAVQQNYHGRTEITNVTYLAARYALTRLSLQKMICDPKPSVKRCPSYRLVVQFLLHAIDTANSVVSKYIDSEWQNEGDVATTLRLSKCNTNINIDDGDDKKLRQRCLLMHACLDIVSGILLQNDIVTFSASIVPSEGDILVGELTQNVEAALSLMKFLLSFVEVVCPEKDHNTGIRKEIDNFLVLFTQLVSMLHGLTDYCDHQRMQISFHHRPRKVDGGQSTSFSHEAISDGMWVDTIHTVVAFMTDTFVPGIVKFYQLSSELKMSSTKRMCLGRLIAQCKILLIKLQVCSQGRMRMNASVHAEKMHDIRYYKDTGVESGDYNNINDSDDEFEPSDWSDDENGSSEEEEEEEEEEETDEEDDDEQNIEDEEEDNDMDDDNEVSED